MSSELKILELRWFSDMIMNHGESKKKIQGLFMFKRWGGGGAASTYKKFPELIPFFKDFFNNAKMTINT